MSTPTEEYVTARVEQVLAAVSLRKDDLLVGIIGLIRADGYPEFADLLINHLIEQGLRNVVASAATR